MITASQDADKVAVFLNDGKGGFPGPAGGYVGYIQKGQGGSINAPYTDFYFQDIDGDGKPDLALVDQQQSFDQPWQFTVALNDGTGHFGPPIQSPMADGTGIPIGHLLGDFRNTGRPDLLVYECGAGCEGPPALVFAPNIGNGQFGTPKTTQLDVNTFGGLGAIAAGDFNKDGKLDFVIATGLPGTSPPSSSGSLGLTLFLGNGDGTFRQQPTIPYAPTIASGTTFPLIFANDFNLDGNLDVLVWYTTDEVGAGNLNGVYEFLGKGDGTFSAPKLVLPNFNNFAMADLNHDGLPDIVEYSTLPVEGGFIAPASYSVYLGQPDGSFSFSQTYTPYSDSFTTDYLFDNGRPSQRLSPMLADFNGDGNIDIASFQFVPSYPNTTTYMQILAGNGDGTFTPTYAAFNLDKRGFPSTAVDVNGDGRADLIEVDGWSSSYHVILGVPGPTVQLQLARQPIVGTSGTLIVNLSLPATSGATVQLSASDPNISIPASVTVPSGSLSANVPFAIGAAYNSSRVFALNATLSGQTATIYSYQTTAALAGFNLSALIGKAVAPPSGTTPNYNIILLSVGGYSTAAVQFSCQGLPAGTTCSFGSNSLGLSSGQSLSNSLTIEVPTNTSLGTYSFQVAATDGAVTTQLPLKLVVADFSLSVSPASLTVVEGTTANLNLAIQGTSGWTDLVATTCVVSPQVPNGPRCSGGGALLFAGTYSVTVSTLNVSPADFTIQFSGSADAVTHLAAPVTLHIQNAIGAVSPTSAQISVGSSANFNVSLTSQNGLADQFTFTCPGLPAGISCSFNPPSGSLPANGTLSTTLTINVTSRPAVFHGFPLNAQPKLRIFLFLLNLAALAMIFLLLFHAYRSLRSTPSLSASAAWSALFVAVVLLGAVSCGGGSGGGTQAPPPPTVTLQANPAFVSAAGSSTLTWTSTNATQLSISPGVGSVAPQGSTIVQPANSTTYTISASGPGGSTSASAAVTVNGSLAVSVTVQATSPSVTVTPGAVAVTIP